MDDPSALRARCDLLEAIVRDLAGKGPTRHGWVHGAAWILSCSQCDGYTWANEAGKTLEPIEHTDTCAWKRAVDATRREEG